MYDTLGVSANHSNHSTISPPQCHILHQLVLYVHCIFKPGARRPTRAWFFEIAFVREVGSVRACVRACVRVCVPTPEAINNNHVILNLYNQLNKFVALET